MWTTVRKILKYFKKKFYLLPEATNLYVFHIRGVQMRQLV